MGTDPSDIREAIDNTRNRMSDTFEAIGDKIDEAKTSIGQSTDLVRERTGAVGPLGLFIGAAAVGFVLGSILPGSDIENTRLGPVREQLKKKAQAAGGQLLKQGQAVVRDTVDAAKGAATQSASEHGRM